MAQVERSLDLEPFAPIPGQSGPTYWLGRRWELVKDYWSILRPMRFCVLVWIGISFLILFLPQSQDALLALFEDVFNDAWLSVANLAAFALLALLWAFQTFYWARFVSRLPARERPTAWYEPPILSNQRIEELNARIPRRIGAVVLLSVWIAVLKANWFNILQEITASATMVILLLLYFWLIARRRQIVNALNRRNYAALTLEPRFRRDLDPNKIRLDPLVKRWGLGLAAPTLAVLVASGFAALPKSIALETALAIAFVWLIFGFWAAGRIDGVPPSTRLWLRLNVAVFGTLFLASIDPHMPLFGWPSGLPSAPIIMSVAAAWVFIGTFFLAVPGELLRLPITTFVALFALAASVVGFSDNHVVRTSEQSPASGITIEDAFNQWWTNVPKTTEPVPLVLVATAGGASRAAYWTTKVLAQIERDHPGFHQHVFAISSVSGGSLGAAVYRTMLNDVVQDSGPAGGSQCPARMAKATKTNLVDCGLKVIDHDFLGPAFLTGLYADLTQRFLPGSLLPDRGGALERSWEAAWNATMPGSSPGLDRPFHSLWNVNRDIWLPALIINGTSEKTGRRIITSNLLIDPDRFTDAIDFFAKVSPTEDIPVSTAAHNSARFPYIDAAGTLMNGHRIADRIVDGGYFENFGAGSIYDLLRALYEIKGDKKIKFFVIQITSDPELENQQAERDITWKEHNSPFGLNIASDATAPPVALFNTGSALGYRAKGILKDFVEKKEEESAKPDRMAGAHDSYFAEFRLLNTGVTLSWVLSRKAVELLDQEWDNNKTSYDTLKTFMKWN